MRDLSNIKKSTTNQLLRLNESLRKAKTPKEVANIVTGHIGTSPKAQKIAKRLETSKSLAESWQIVYNSILAGSDMAVL